MPGRYCRVWYTKRCFISRDWNHMKISIVTPSYNQGHFIWRTIDSVISQRGDFEIEYIVMDGGSSDTTVDVLRSYEEKIVSDSRYAHVTFIWKSEKDKGQSDAINKWLRIATGDILTYINSDDTYESGCFDEIINVLSQENSDRCYGKCHIIDEKDNEIRKRLTWYKNLWLNSGRSYGKLLTENFISQMTVFRTRKAFKEIWFFNEDEHLCMDYEYWLRLGKKYTPTYIPSYLANFRFYTTSKSWTFYTKQFSDQYRLAKKYAEVNYRFALFVHKLFRWRTVRVYKMLEILWK